MSRSLPMIPDSELASPASGVPTDDGEGFGSLRTERGGLPLEAMEVHARIDGLLSRVVVRQTFVNACGEPLEAAYIFPLPDRAAVSAFRMTVGGREIQGTLEERCRRVEIMPRPSPRAAAQRSPRRTDRASSTSAWATSCPASGPPSS